MQVEQPLLPCPFCGSDAEYAFNPFYCDETMATCKSCAAAAFWKKWNTRSTPSVLAESTSNDCLLVAEAVRERCAGVAEQQFGDKPGTWFRAARVRIASAIRSLDLSGVGVG